MNNPHWAFCVLTNATDMAVQTVRTRALYAPAIAALETGMESFVRDGQQVRLGCRCSDSCKCSRAKCTNESSGLLMPLSTQAETKLRTLLKARTRLAAELTKPRMKLDSVQDRRVDYVTLSAIDESLRRVCAFEKDPPDCGTDTTKYCNWVESIFASNAHNSVKMSEEKRKEASGLCTLARELGECGPSMQKNEASGSADARSAGPSVRALLRKKALDSLTQGDKLPWGTDPHYEYKSGTSMQLRSHPAVLACGSDAERANAMEGCFTQVLADRRHNLLSPLLAQEMTRTLMAAVGMRPDATDAPTGIPTIKQTPKYAPEQVLELLAADSRPRWRRALGVENKMVAEEFTAPDWSRKEIEPDSVARTGYTAKKFFEELRLAMAANTQKRNERGELAA